MALITSKINNSAFCCSLTITDSGQFNTLPMIVGEVPWRINFRINEENEKKLFASLSCEYEGENSKWWIEGEANLKLLSSKAEKKPIEMKLGKTKFMESSRMSEWDSIRYEDFGGQDNGYIQNNVFAIECAIIPSPMIKEPCLPSSNNVIRASQQFIMKVEKLDELKSIISSKYTLRGTKWHVELVKKDEKLGLYLNKDKSDQDLTLSVEVTFIVKLLSFCGVTDPFQMKFTHAFMAEDSKGWGWLEFLDWNTFMDKDKQYVKNNTAFFDIVIQCGPWKSMWQRENNLKENQSGCPICLEQLDNKNVVATKCGHLFCENCIKSSIERTPKCPVCKNTVSKGGAGLRKIFLNQ